jgi:enediyne polyketide synthase
MRDSPDLAIVGLACRFPEAASPAELWDNVLSQRRSFRRLPRARLRAEDYLCDDPAAPDAVYTWVAAVLAGYEFDRVRFRISGNTYRATDISHWLALEVAGDCLTDAGFPEGAGLPRDATAVVVGNTLTGDMTRAHALRLRWPFVRRVVRSHLETAGLSGEQVRELLESMEATYKAPFPPVGEDSLAGALANTIAGRICNYFDFRGCGYIVDGACASSLLAVTTVCTQLAGGEIDAGLAGGVDLSIDPFELVGFAKTGALAREEMHVYDRRAGGFWPGEGCGFALLMRAEDAVAEGRPVYARIRGWGASSDGAGGITRPEVEGQRLALRRAHRRGGVEPESVAYVEGHGTGTAIGDRVELEALATFRQEARAASPVVVGSVKANIGHTKAAAGIAGLIKATVALRQGVVPPNTACEHPMPPASEGDGPLTVLREARPWPADRPCAGVSGMGFGGVNVHVVLEAPARVGPGVDARTRSLVRTAQDAELLLFSAADRQSLEKQVRGVRERAGDLSWGELRDLACALAAETRLAEWRLALVARSPAELDAGLAEAERLLAEGETGRLDAGRALFLGSGPGAPRIGFLFPGQGVPSSHDGGGWSRRFPSVERLYRDACLPADGRTGGTESAQRAIATASLAGLAVLSSLGIEGTIAVGHSLGELCAYHWAGALTASTLTDLIRARAQAMAATCPPGTAMATVAADLETAQALLAGTGTVVAAVNASFQVVLAGSAADVAEVTARAQRAGIAALRLPVAHAFHSPFMRQAGELLVPFVTVATISRLRRRVASTITGEILDVGADVRQLVVRHVTERVRFVEAAELASKEADLFVEVGPGHVLSHLIESSTTAIPLDVGSPSLHGLLACAGAAHALGAPIRAGALFQDRVRKPFHLDEPPVFLGNPCEKAPEEDVAAFAPIGGNAAPPHVQHEVSHAGQWDVARLVRELVAGRVELPAESLRSGDRLLEDLHLSSVTVAQIVQDALAALRLPPAVAPTSFAKATLGELGQALGELAELPPGESSTDDFEGLAPWVRPFRTEHRELPTLPDPGDRRSGEWNVRAPDGDALADRLRSTLPLCANARGVAVCLGRTPGANDVERLLHGAQEAISTRADVFLVVQRGGGGSAFARSLAQEVPDLATVVVDLDAGIDLDLAVRLVVAEAAAVVGVSEVTIGSDGVRREPVLVPVAIPECPGPPPLSAGDVVLVTGGGKGIGAECALALGRATGARLALMGRAQQGEDQVLDGALQRLAEEGLDVCYRPADVVDAEQVRQAVIEIQEILGPITAVVHSAGVNMPAPVASLDLAQALGTLRPKVHGLRNVLAALDPTRLRLVVGFGSLIARTGMHGEAHYGLANEWLALEVERFGRASPHCRCLTLEWSAWAGVGMAERLGAGESLARAGVQAMPVERALAAMSSVLSVPELDGRIVITSRFARAVPAILQHGELRLLRFLERPRVHYPGIELVVDFEESADSDPYLDDHVFDGYRVVPAALLLEAMAQVATASAPGHIVTGFDQVEFHHPVVVPELGRRTVRVATLVKGDRVDVAVRSDTDKFLTDHARAVCRVGAAGVVPSGPIADRLAFAAARGSAPGVDADRDLYGSLLFQSGRFRRVRRYRQLGASLCIAEVEARDESWFGTFLPAGLLLGDPGVRDAALHCVQACIPHVPVLPVGIGTIEMCTPLARDYLLVVARERVRSETEYHYDIDIYAPDGQLCERWSNVRFRPSGRAYPLGDVPEALLPVVIERRAQDLLGDGDLRIVIEANGGQRRTSSDAAFGRLLDPGAMVTRGSDGRPHVVGSRGAERRGVSAAHVHGLTLAVAGPPNVACDVETVRSRDESEWRTLLGPRRWQLAQGVAQGGPLSAARAAAAVWAATECLAKAGAPPQSPLTLAATSPDGWVVLTAPEHRIATTVVESDRPTGDLAVAVLVSKERG